MATDGNVVAAWPIPCARAMRGAPMIELLLKHGADHRAKIIVDHYITPREDAETFGRLRVVEALYKVTAQ
ncbi:MAG: hypothetical protein KGS09_01000 [Nitrospirae bacterium]|nr:hypothetical protein [Nitrospirota bacterium]